MSINSTSSNNNNHHRNNHNNKNHHHQYHYGALLLSCSVPVSHLHLSFRALFLPVIVSAGLGAYGSRRCERLHGPVVGHVTWWRSVKGFFVVPPRALPHVA